MSAESITYLADVPRVHAARRGNHVAVECEGRKLTYAELDRRPQAAVVDHQPWSPRRRV